MISAVQPKTTRKDGWINCGQADPYMTLGYPGFVFENPQLNLFVITAVEVMESGATYHLSMSRDGHRCSRAEAKYILKCFGMQDAEEDNHVPSGVARNFFLPVNENLIGHECPCKVTEPAIVEDKGEYVWRGVESP